MGKTDTKGAPVENYRLTEEQVAFQKKFGTMQKIRKLLEAKTLQLKYEGDNLAEQWKIWETGLKSLDIPTEAVKDLPGMNFEEQMPQGTPWEVKY